MINGTDKVEQFSLFEMDCTSSLSDDKSGENVAELNIAGLWPFTC